jgi:hypothetical protein
VRRFNQALLGKWLWRFAHEEGAWWRTVLVAKYGTVWGGWRSGVISDSHGVGLWKYICMGGRFSRVTLDLIQGRALRFVFGMMYGVGIDLLRLCSPGCSILLASRKRLLRTMWSELIALSNGIFSLHG